MVGLTGWPEIQTTASGFTVQDLPTRIQEVSDYGTGETYEVTWSLEPPADVPSGYAFVEVTDENLSSYPSVAKTGWYYMLQSDFVLNVEGKLGGTALTEADLRTILSSFQFVWTYSGSQSSDSIRHILEGSEAEAVIDGSRVTISGLWKYNLDGSVIT